jgi:hypothetical protein
VPDGQAHVPAVHSSVGGQAFAHAPQLASSVLVSTHAPPQSVVPAGQFVVQAPFEHTWLAPQVLPHVPQFFGSLVRSLHVPGVHSLVPVSHVHLPPKQLARASVHAVLQLPQWLRSVLGSTQPWKSSATTHRSSPLGHAQAAIWHVSGAVQTVPQRPQLPSSLLGSTHSPLQAICGL